MDRDPSHDQTLMMEYEDEIFSHCREMETTLQPDIGYLERMPESAWAHRMHCIEIMTETRMKMRILPEPLFLGVNLFDRVLNKISRKFHDNKMVLVITSFVCLLIAAKFEQRVGCMRLREYTRLMGQFGYQVEVTDFQLYEREILRLLDYRVGWPGPLPFLRRCLRGDGDNDDIIYVRSITRFILELVLLDPRFLIYKPSLQAAAAVYISRWMMGRTEWVR
ncbi:cyclin-like protein [Lobosporangium transversale]|uniref:Cyclin-like protein n=1 Tax=Lobosporangium transversale TaxID=64571 RepID=A0A1Y2GH07_9FUNG|nr:cyclin-like protein [Lobosporangium transversale]ORZ10668.1 cyclin-like protein [Lobosporangium transversale]|eukprot:XP_021879389.1 cyclin-like protein [Lobosporangium transversale]